MGTEAKPAPLAVPDPGDEMIDLLVRD
jgi:hypothetical protein